MKHFVEGILIFPVTQTLLYVICERHWTREAELERQTLLPHVLSSFSSQRRISILPLGPVAVSNPIFLLHPCSFHPFPCMWVDDSASLQKGLHMRGPQHYLPLCARRGHTRWITHRWRRHDYWPRCEYSPSSSLMTQQSVCCHCTCIPTVIWEPLYVFTSRSPWGSVTGCASGVSAPRPSSGTCMCPVCTRSLAASCLAALSACHWPTWPS